METINDQVFEKLSKLPIVNQRDSVRLDKDKVYVVKQLKKAEQGINIQKDKARREIDVAEQLIKQENPSKYIVKYYQASETEKYYYLIMEKCEGSLDDLFRENEIIRMPSQKRVELIIKLFYQIIQGYKYIKKIYPNFIHRDLCLDNIFYKKETNNEYIAKIADYGAIKLNYGTLTFDFNRKAAYMPPEAQKDKGTGKYLDNLDVYTLGVCLYKMFFGLTSQVQYNNNKLDLPNESKNDSYCKFLDLLNKMLEKDFTKRLGWQELYSLLYQFPQILSTKGRDDDDFTNNQNYLQESLLEQHKIGKLLDTQMKKIASEFNQLFRRLAILSEQQLMTITIMKYTFQQQFQQSLTLAEDQFEENILMFRSARYLANVAGLIEYDFIQRDQRFIALLLNNEQQYQILRGINKPIKPYFQLFIRNKLQKGSFTIF